MPNQQRSIKLTVFQGLVLALLASPLISLTPFDRLLTDAKFKWRGRQEPSGKVVIVEIDSPSIEAIGRWPWRRDYLAVLIDQIFKRGARNVGLDVVFSEPQTDYPKADAILASVLKKYHDRLTLSWVTENLCIKDCPVGTAILPPGGYQGEIQTASFVDPILNIAEFTNARTEHGFANAIRDPDGIIRQAQLLLRKDGFLYRSLPMSLAMQNGMAERIPKFQSSMPVNYYGSEGTIAHLSAIQVMKEDERELASESSILKDKTVIIGISALAVGDRVATPFSPSVPGVEVQATIADNIIARRIPREDKYWVWGLSGLFAILLLWASQRASNQVLTILYPATLMVYVGLDFGVLFPRGFHWATGVMYAQAGFLAVSTLMSRFYEESERRRFLKTAFSRYLAPSVVKTIVARPEALTLGGVRKELTILFCDLRGFTTLSEKLEPSQLTQLLNEYFTLLSEEIFREEGTVDKYIGDALMAFFGAPLDQKDHAARACRAAGRMLKAFEERRTSFRERYGADLKLGIGINTGIVSVGNMGSEHRMSYTVIGDAVNIASRIESATKIYGASILTTGTTLESITKAGSEIPNYREVDKVRVKGKSLPIQLLELGSSSSGTFEKAYALYQGGRFLEAASLFEGLNSDPAAKVLLARCQQLIQTPPTDWQGIWDLQFK